MSLLNCQSSISPCIEPLLIGHRGTPKYAPENTIPAFKTAIEQGGDGIEMDVKLTKDNYLVILHDDTTGRTTDDSLDRKITEIDLVDLKKLDAGKWFDEEYAGTRIPLVQEVVDSMGKDIFYIFEIKNTEKVIQPLAKLIEENEMENQVFVMSFWPDILHKFWNEMPEIKLIYSPSSYDKFEFADYSKATYIRLPKSIQDNTEKIKKIKDYGYRIVKSGGQHISWDNEIFLSNTMPANFRIRRNNKPEYCTK